MSLCVVQYTAKIHYGGGEVQVGEVNLSVQLNHISLWVPLVTDFQDLESDAKEVKVMPNLVDSRRKLLISCTVYK